MTQAPIPAPASVIATVQSFLVNRTGQKLFETMDWVEVFKEALSKEISTAQSNQGALRGRRAHPYSFDAVERFRTANVHHSTCLHTKVTSTIGLGHRSGGSSKVEKLAPMPGELPKPPQVPEETIVDKTLNPLCDTSWAETQHDVCEDFWEKGNGFLEVVRTGPKVTDPIVGIHHIPAKEVYVYVENEQRDRHFEIVGGEGSGAGLHWPRFGDSEAFAERVKRDSQITSAPLEGQTTFSEVIHVRYPTSLSRWYGHADWLACVPSVELVQMMIQHKFDFFLNRGVPEFMLFITGAILTPDDWKKIETAMLANIGLGNSHKSIAMNIQNENIKIQLEKLAMEKGGQSDDGKEKEDAALDIVSAHRVPPLLAGIQIPGKLGATNELPNALMAFQVLVIAPAQRIFQSVLGTTLGNPALNGGLALTMKDFAYNSILDQIDLGVMSTVGGMRQPVTQANSQGRDLSAGMKQ